MIQNNESAGRRRSVEAFRVIGALRRRVAALEAELIEERVLTAELTDRLEICRECPAGMIQTAVCCAALGESARANPLQVDE